MDGLCVQVGWLPKKYSERGAVGGDPCVNALSTFIEEVPYGEDPLECIKELVGRVVALGGDWRYIYAGVETPQREFYPWTCEPEEDTG